LWSIFRSPLMMGGNLTLSDEWTKSLLTNAEVLAVDQHSTANHAVLTTEKAAVWLARPASGDGYYVALFNLDSGAQTFDYSWKEGDNCLLTGSSAHIDLPFSPLIA